MRPEEYQAMFDLEDHLWWYDGMREITMSLIDASLGGRDGLRLLDIGCGTGYMLEWLSARLAPEAAFGVDASPSAAEFWARRGVQSAAIASASDLPFAGDEFNLVTCFDVIYQFTRADAEAALAEAFRVLKPGGLFLIREPAYNWMRGGHDHAVGTRSRYTLSGLKRMAERAGFSVRRSTYANTLLFWMAVPHRLLSRMRGDRESDVRPVPRWRNELFASALRLEAKALRRIGFPFGLSVILVAEKRA